MEYKDGLLHLTNGEASDIQNGYELYGDPTIDRDFLLNMWELPEVPKDSYGLHVKRTPFVKWEEREFTLPCTELEARRLMRLARQYKNNNSPNNPTTAS
jgi:hypothetical protein